MLMSIRFPHKSTATSRHSNSCLQRITFKIICKAEQSSKLSLTGSQPLKTECISRYQFLLTATPPPLEFWLSLCPCNRHGFASQQAPDFEWSSSIRQIDLISVCLRLRL